MQNQKHLVKVTLWMDKRLRRALKVVCTYRNVSITSVVKYLAAYYVANDGVLPTFDTKRASQKILKYASAKNAVGRADFRIEEEGEDGEEEFTSQE